MYYSLDNQILLIIVSVITISQTSCESTHWTPVCQNEKGKMLLSNDDISIFTIKEGSNLKTFITDFDEENIKCASSTEYPEDEYEKKAGSEVVKIVKLKRINEFNSKVSVACEDVHGTICSASLIVLWKNSKLQKECQINRTLSCDINGIKEQRNISGKNDIPKEKFPQPATTTTEKSYVSSDLGRSQPPTAFDHFLTLNRHPIPRFGQNENESRNDSSISEYSEDYDRTDIETTTVIAISPPSLSSLEAVKYSIYVNNTVRKYIIFR